MDNNVLNANKFLKFKDKARRLIHEDAKNDAHIIKERNRDRAAMLNKTVQDNSGYGELMPSYSTSNYTPTIQMNENEEVGERGQMLDNALEERLSELRIKAKNRGVSESQYAETPKRSGLPKEILESFQATNVDYEKLNPKQSILDIMGVTSHDGQEQQHVKETVEPAVNQSNPQVDYSLIKDIVENAVKKYISGYSKKIIEESKKTSNTNGEVKAIKIGDKFSFITENGDIYEAKLTFKKNINE